MHNWARRHKTDLSLFGAIAGAGALFSKFSLSMSKISFETTFHNQISGFTFLAYYKIWGPIFTLLLGQPSEIQKHYSAIWTSMTRVIGS